MNNRRLLAALATYWLLVQASACLGSLAGGYFVQQATGQVLIGVAYGLGGLTLTASSSYVAFGCDPLRFRLAAHLVAFLASAGTKWAAGTLMAAGILAGLAPHGDLGFPSGLELAARIAAGSVPAFAIVPAVLYCLHPTLGLVAIGPAPRRLFTTRSILAATTAIAFGLGAAVAFKQSPNLRPHFSWLTRDLLIVVSALLTVLGRRPIVGPSLFVISFPLTLMALWGHPRPGTLVVDWPMFLAWSVTSWASLDGLFLILRCWGFRLSRETTVAAGDPVTEPSTDAIGLP